MEDEFDYDSDDASAEIIYTTADEIGIRDTV